MQQSKDRLEGMQESSMVVIERFQGFRCGIRKLPVEIMTRIFTMACHARFETPPVEAIWGDSGSWFEEIRERGILDAIVIRGYHGWNSAGPLAAVCRDWRQWVYNDAALWSRLTIGLGTLTQRQGLGLLKMLHRTKQHKLDIRLVTESSSMGWLWPETRRELAKQLEEALVERTEVLRCSVRAFLSHGLLNARRFKAVKTVTLEYEPSLDVLPTGQHEDQI
ncbi:hypothetical protein AAF712_013752 [Marasmius tenuissimus]|uniref:F-box domain-containing protein n=1 Tax=Marasmius tenuissimus TaxID=585030 RepID=A0ABR2ZG96_9AGAR